MKRGTAIYWVAIFFAVGAAVFALQSQIDSTKEAAYRETDSFLYLPDADHLKIASLGYENTVADILWIKVVIQSGEKKISSRGYDWMYKALDTLTTLDPVFVTPYEMGALMLTIVADKVDLSDKLLEKGVIYNTDVWQLYFYLGFNKFFFDKDYLAAAKNMEKAASIKGSPPYTSLLASRLYVQAEDPVYALDFLEKMYSSSKDERMREEIGKRMHLLEAQVIVNELQKAADYFKEKAGRAPESLGEMARAGLIKAVPPEPNGGRFYIDTDGKVKSSAVKENLGIYRQH
ncbi:MAG TPA: hypothetical protein VGK71_06110 [Nitrospirota bacterium]